MQAVAGYRLLASNASAVLAGRLVSIALGVTLATVLFKALGPQQYGAWSLLTLIAGYSTLIDFGLAAAIERRVATLVARDAHARIAGTLNSTVLALAAAVGVAQMVVVALLAPPFLLVQDPSLRRALLALPVCTGITLTSLAVGAVLAGQQRMRTLHLWRTLGLAFGTAAVIAAVKLGIVGLDALLVIYTTGSIVTLALVWRALRRTVPGLRLALEWDREAARDLVWFGGVIQVATMVPPIAEYAFRLIVGARFGLAFAGVYDLGARAAVVPRSISGALFSAMVPFAVQTERRDGATGLTRLVRTTARHVALFILPATAVSLAFAGPLIRVWLGEAELAGQVRRCFEVVLVAHALGAVAVPAAMIGRALGRPAAEATATATAFVAAVVAAQFAPSFVVAAALLWGLPALGGFVVWAWLGRTLRFGFVSAADLALAALVAAVVFAAARPFASETVGTVAVLMRLTAASLAAGLGACLVELSDAERRATARNLLFPSPPSRMD